MNWGHKKCIGHRKFWQFRLRPLDFWSRVFPHSHPTHATRHVFTAWADAEREPHLWTNTGWSVPMVVHVPWAFLLIHQWTVSALIYKLKDCLWPSLPDCLPCGFPTCLDSPLDHANQILVISICLHITTTLRPLWRGKACCSKWWWLRDHGAEVM
jgi:hypothetical protein